MKKEEAPMKKTEAGSSKPLRVEYSAKTERSNSQSLVPKLCGGVIGLLVAIILVVLFFSYFITNPQCPRFMLEDLYINPTTNSTLVKLSSQNPSSKSGIDYNKMRVHVWIIGGFETENVNLPSTLQEPREITRWTAPLATNNDYGKRPGGSFQGRNGVTSGQVIVDFSLQWKGAGIISLITRSLRAKCPVSINLKDLTSVVPRPLARCSTSFT